MNKAIPTYEERIQNPSLSIINFSYVIMHPESISEVWNKYCFDTTFRMQVNQKIKTDVMFKRKFYELFKEYIINTDIPIFDKSKKNICL